MTVPPGNKQAFASTLVKSIQSNVQISIKSDCGMAGLPNWTAV